MAVSNTLIKQPEQPEKVGLTAYLTENAVKDQINKVIGGKNGQRFITSIISAVQANPALKECSNNSIVSAALIGESLGLSPSPQLGHYYMVPYNNGSTNDKNAQFQIGYKGLIQLAIRSGQYKKLNVIAIKEGELVSFNPLDEEIEVRLIDDEVERERANTIGYYAMFEYTNGFRKAIYWSKEKMEAHALRYSQGYKKKKGYTFWEKDFDSMAYKTMLRQLISKWGIMSIDMQTAYESDMAVIREDGTKDYVDVYEPTESPTIEKNEKAEEIPTNEEKAPKKAQNEVEKALFG